MKYVKTLYIVMSSHYDITVHTEDRLATHHMSCTSQHLRPFVGYMCTFNKIAIIEDSKNDSNTRQFQNSKEHILFKLWNSTAGFLCADPVIPGELRKSHSLFVMRFRTASSSSSIITHFFDMELMYATLGWTELWQENHSIRQSRCFKQT